MKTVWFVRHGQTNGNAGGTYHHSDTPLNKLGSTQANLVAQRLVDYGAEALVVSTMARALSTGQAISAATGLRLEPSELFVERRLPSVVQGQPKTSPVAKEVVRAIRHRYHDVDFRHSDEETFADQRSRAASACQSLENRPEKRLIVVTHGIFQRMMLAHMIHGEALTSHEAAAINRLMQLANTGISTFTYDAERWRLVSWGDCSHLDAKSFSL